MDLLDTHLPHFQFREQHSIDIRATAARIMAVVQAYDSCDDTLLHKILDTRTDRPKKSSHQHQPVYPR